MKEDRVLRYIIKRFVVSLLTLLVLVTAVFFLVRAMPDDPFLSEKLRPEIRENMLKYYGFDRPVHEQYFRYLGIRALLLAIVAGTGLGIVSALNRGKWLDYVYIIVAILGVSLPDFVSGYLLQFVFGIKLKLLPIALWRGFKYTILPTVALSFYTTALLTRIMRASMLEVVGQDFIKVAKAKGLSTYKIVTRHQIRNAILPVVTVLGPITAAILTGTFVIESIYAILGMGKFYVVGIQNLDYSQILGLTVFYGAFLIAANFLVDILYGLIDPRIRIYRRDDKQA